MTTEEMLLQLIEGQKQMSADISNLKEGQKQMVTDFNKRFDKIENDISEMKEDIEMLTANSNHNGEFLEKFSKIIEPYNIGIKY